MNKSPDQLTIVKSAPISFRLAKYFQRTGVRGGHRLEDVIRNLGWLDKIVTYNLPNNVSVGIPIAERPFDLEYVLEYESSSIRQIKAIIEKYDEDFCLIDCGADIGLMSAKFISASSAIKSVLAFEPNLISYKFLDYNLKSLAIDAKAYNMGVSDFNGNAELKFPDFDSHDHAAYVEPSENGDFKVSTIDNLSINNKSIFIKIDVEGAELSVLRGAEDTIMNTDNVVIIFEAHPKQVQRTGVDPVEIVKYICDLKKCHIEIMEEPNKEIDLNIPFFQQVSNKVYNICVYSI